MLLPHPFTGMAHCVNKVSYIRIGDSVNISAWASKLLVQLDWAMRRPRFVGRVTGRIPRFLLFCRQLKLVISPIEGFGGKMEVQI